MNQSTDRSHGQASGTGWLFHISAAVSLALCLAVGVLWARSSYGTYRIGFLYPTGDWADLAFSSSDPFWEHHARSGPRGGSMYGVAYRATSTGVAQLELTRVVAGTDQEVPLPQRVGPFAGTEKVMRPAWSDITTELYMLLHIKDDPLSINPPPVQAPVRPPFWASLGFALERQDDGQTVLRRLSAPQWFVLLLTSVLPLAWLVRMRRRRRRQPGLCAKCGYNLGATPHRCPESGTVARAASPEAPSESREDQQHIPERSPLDASTGDATRQGPRTALLHLDYAPPPRLHQRLAAALGRMVPPRYRRELLHWGVCAVIVVYSGWLMVRLVPNLMRRQELLAARPILVERCSNFTMGAATVVFDEAAEKEPAYGPNAGDGLRMCRQGPAITQVTMDRRLESVSWGPWIVPECLGELMHVDGALRRLSHAEYLRCVPSLRPRPQAGHPWSCLRYYHSLVFLHALRTPSGRSELVRITFDGPSFVWSLPNPFWDEYGQIPFDFAPPPDKPLRLYAAQPDPADPSHFTIAYKAGDEEGVIDGYLQDDGRVRLRERGRERANAASTATGGTPQTPP